MKVLILFAHPAFHKSHTNKILIKGLAEMEGVTFHDLYEKVRAADLIDCVCRACSAKMGVLEQIEEQGLYLSDEMQGHPSISRYIDEGFEIITF